MARDNYIEVQLEDIQAKFDTILEIVVPMNNRLIEIENRYNEDIPQIKSDIAAIKASLKITNNTVRDHEQRITRLEVNTI